MKKLSLIPVLVVGAFASRGGGSGALGTACRRGGQRCRPCLMCALDAAAEARAQREVAATVQELV